MNLLKLFSSAAIAFISIGFADVLINGELLIWNVITGVPEYLTRFVMLSTTLVPSWVMGIVIMAMSISLALLIVKVFNHLTSPLT